MNRQQAREIIQGLTNEQLEALAVFTETADVQGTWGSPDGGDSIYEDDVQGTLNNIAYDFRRITEARDPFPKQLPAETVGSMLGTFYRHPGTGLIKVIDRAERIPSSPHTMRVSWRVAEPHDIALQTVTEGVVTNHQIREVVILPEGLS